MALDPAALCAVCTMPTAGASILIEQDLCLRHTCLPQNLHPTLELRFLVLANTLHLGPRLHLLLVPLKSATYRGPLSI